MCSSWLTPVCQVVIYMYLPGSRRQAGCRRQRGPAVLCPPGLRRLTGAPSACSPGCAAGSLESADRGSQPAGVGGPQGPSLGCCMAKLQGCVALCLDRAYHVHLQGATLPASRQAGRQACMHACERQTDSQEQPSCGAGRRTAISPRALLTLHPSSFLAASRLACHPQLPFNLSPVSWRRGCGTGAAAGSCRWAGSASAGAPA